MTPSTRAALIVLAALLVLELAAVVPLAPFGVRAAEAVVGRPLTPVSYAGVARRTSRRTARRTSARWAAASATTITALPAGCHRTVVGGPVYYQCASVWYRPYYQGSTVVYQTVAAP